MSNLRQFGQVSPKTAAGDSQASLMALVSELYVNWGSTASVAQELKGLVHEYRAAMYASAGSTTGDAEEETPTKHTDPNGLLQGGSSGSSPSPPGSPPVSSRMPPKKPTASSEERSPSIQQRFYVDELDARSKSPGAASPVSPNAAIATGRSGSAESPGPAPSIPLAGHGHGSPLAEIAHGNIFDRDLNSISISNSSVGGHASNRPTPPNQSLTSLVRSGRIPVASHADIPQFHRPAVSMGVSEEGAPEEIEALQRILAGVPAAGSNARGPRGTAERQVQRDVLAEICTQVFRLPEWLTDLLHRRIAGHANLTYTEGMLLTGSAVRGYFEAHFANKTPRRRLFELIKGDHKSPHQFLTHDDLKEAVRYLVRRHPGLDFLQAPEFQDFYCRTVAIRIMFQLEVRQSRKVQWPQFDKSDLPDIMYELDNTTDINQILRFFSYEHFYVLYCRFWELDMDRNQLLELGDLERYSQMALTRTVLQRVIAGAGRKLSSGVEGSMDYEDFVYFCLAEEDKNCPPAVHYWFKVLDLDGDGMLSGYELGYFFEEQSERMLEYFGEELRYEDMMCQMLDMVGATKIKNHPLGLTLADLRSCPTPANFFNMIFNAQKFNRFEHRDPFGEHHMRLQPEKTDWDRFARAEYDRMASEAGQ